MASLVLVALLLSCNWVMLAKLNLVLQYILMPNSFMLLEIMKDWISGSIPYVLAIS